MTVMVCVAVCEAVTDWLTVAVPVPDRDVVGVEVGTTVKVAVEDAVSVRDNEAVWDPVEDALLVLV